MLLESDAIPKRQSAFGFNGHPPLGVNATGEKRLRSRGESVAGFNGHPPLGVNATSLGEIVHEIRVLWRGFNGHPPLGVNATG